MGDNDELAIAMNAKLNVLMNAEFGPDDGRDLPEIEGVDWAPVGRTCDLASKRKVAWSF